MQRYRDNKDYYLYVRNKKERPRGEMGLDWEEEEEEEMEKEDDGRKISPEMRKYEALCRGESQNLKVGIVFQVIIYTKENYLVMMTFFLHWSFEFNNRSWHCMYFKVFPPEICLNS